MQTALSVLVDSVLITFVFALAALGLAIIFGLMGVINMGHGAMLTLGAYFTWFATTKGVPFVAAVLLAAAGVGLIGLLLEHFIIRHFYDRPFETLLLTWGFFLISTELIKIAFGTDLRTVTNPLPGAAHFGSFVLPAYQSVVALISLALIIGLGVMLYRTGLGIKIRALVQNAEVASLLGLNVARAYKLVFVAGSAAAGLAGALISPMLSVDPYIGNIFLVRSFFVVIVGGIGQVLGGTLVGSFLIGGSETFFALFSGQVVAQTIVFMLAILVLRFRPAGVLRAQ
ncbi:MAG: branched-chain amino acid ABC transporter permease [Acetobacteraceae bacterium]|nr:branched-chain amino acid ABC transporter permease [Acetobacteraceae bacterium]